FMKDTEVIFTVLRSDPFDIMFETSMKDEIFANKESLLVFLDCCCQYFSQKPVSNHGMKFAHWLLNEGPPNFRNEEFGPWYAEPKALDRSIRVATIQAKLLALEAISPFPAQPFKGQQNDKAFIQNNGAFFRHADPELKKDRDFCLQAVSWHIGAFSYVCDEL